MGAIALLGEQAFFGVALEQTLFDQIAGHVDKDGIVEQRPNAGPWSSVSSR